MRSKRLFVCGTDTADMVERAKVAAKRNMQIHVSIEIVVEYGSSVCWTSKYVAKEQACTK